MPVLLVSFGFKYGMPLDADLVFDVRFLPNPHYVEHLRSLTGKDARVKDYLWRWMVTHKYFQKLQDLLEFSIPTTSAKERSNWWSLSVVPGASIALSLWPMSWAGFSPIATGFISSTEISTRLNCNPKSSEGVSKI